MKELFKLFLIFAKIGAVTFGGGYAMLPILQREIVDRYKWATTDELLDYFAIGQCTPGIIATRFEISATVIQGLAFASSYKKGRVARPPPTDRSPILKKFMNKSKSNNIIYPPRTFSNV